MQTLTPSVVRILDRLCEMSSSASHQCKVSVEDTVKETLDGHDSSYPAVVDLKCVVASSSK